MTATVDDPPRDGDVTTPVRLKFDVIKKRAADLLELEEGADVSDVALGELFEMPRETIWRYRNSKMIPALGTALDLAAKLGLSVEEIAERSPRAEA